MEEKEREKIKKELRKFFTRQNCKISEHDFGCIARLIISIWGLDPYREDEAHKKALFRRLRK